MAPPLVGLLTLAWNAVSCYSYVMTLTQNAAYFRATGVTPEIAAYFAAVPAWYVVAWTIGVWGGLVAAELQSILARRTCSDWRSATGCAQVRSEPCRRSPGWLTAAL